MNTSRSGIFFATYNILKHLSQDSDVEITLYLDDRTKYCELNNITKQNEYSDIKFQILFTPNKVESYVYYKIKTMYIKRKNSNNIITKKLYGSQIKFFRMIQKFLFSKNVMFNDKHYDYFLSPFDDISEEIKNNNEIKKDIIMHFLLKDWRLFVYSMTAAPV